MPAGGSPPDWKFYGMIHQVLGQKDSCNPDLLDDSLVINNIQSSMDQSGKEYYTS